MKKAVIGAIAVIVAAVIAAMATMASPVIANLFSRKDAPAQHTNVQHGGSNNTIHDQSGNSGTIFGDNNQGTQIQNSKDFVINQGRASSHPVTSDMGLKWDQDDFAETVRQGNIPAIKEYLNAKDGFDPNTLWNGNRFVLQLPIFQGTKNFPEVLTLFKETGKLNWHEVDEHSVFGSIYGHPITQEWSLLQEAAEKKHPQDLRALIDAGANPSQLIADEISAFNAPPSASVIYKGELTGRARDMAGANAEQELATFKAIGYALPHLEQAVESASHSPAECAQEVRSHHSLSEALALARQPQKASSGQTLEWDAFGGVVFYLRNELRFGPLAWQGDEVEYARAVATACSPNWSF